MKKITRLLACVLSAAMLMTFSPSAYAQDTSSEIIYVLLDSDGKTREIIGVSGGEQHNGLSGEMPFSINLSYVFDNATVLPQDILGLDGEVKITVDITSNSKTNEYFKENMALQMQFPIDTSKNTAIEADGLTSVTVGTTKTLGAIVMPGSNASFTISYKTQSFEQGSINFAAMPFDMSSATDVDLSSITTQVTQLQNGIGKYTDGISQIDTGMAKASKGLSELALNGEKLILGYSELAAGQQALVTALMAAIPPEMQETLAPQIEALAASQAQLDESLKIYTEGIFTASGGISIASKGLSAAAKQGGVLKDSVKAATAPLTNLTAPEKNGGVSLSPISFMTGGEVSEIQFIMRTDAMAAKAVKEDVTPTVKPKESFWDRLVGLFKKD